MGVVDRPVSAGWLPGSTGSVVVLSMVIRDVCAGQVIVSRAVTARLVQGLWAGRRRACLDVQARKSDQTFLWDYRDPP